MVTAVAPLDRAVRAPRRSWPVPSTRRCSPSARPASCWSRRSWRRARPVSGARRRGQAARGAALAARALYPEPDHVPAVHPTAVLGRGARLGDGVAIGPYVVVGDGAQVGDGTRLDAHVVVGAGVSIGAACHVYPGVTLYPGTDRRGPRARARRRPARVRRLRLRVPRRPPRQDSARRPLRHRGRRGDRREHDDRSREHRRHRDRRGDEDRQPRADRAQRADRAAVSDHGAGRDRGLGARRGRRHPRWPGRHRGAPHDRRGARLAAQAGVFGDIPAGETWSGYPARPHREALRAQAALFKLPSLLRGLERLLGEPSGPSKKEH